MWLINIWKKITNFFFDRGRYTASKLSLLDTKKFRINNETRINPSKKKFEINGIKQVHIRRRGKIEVLSESRPRNCPRCKSDKTIIKPQQRGRTWECSTSKGGCGFRW